MGGGIVTRRPDKRPTLAEIQASTRGAEAGECPRCGCRDLRLRIDPIRLRRVLVCRHCGDQKSN